MEDDTEHNLSVGVRVLLSLHSPLVLELQDPNARMSVDLAACDYENPRRISPILGLEETRGDRLRLAHERGVVPNDRVDGVRDDPQLQILRDAGCVLFDGESALSHDPAHALTEEPEHARSRGLGAPLNTGAGVVESPFAGTRWMTTSSSASVLNFTNARLPPGADILSAAHELEYGHDLYFDDGGHDFNIVALELLVPSKPPETQPESVATAVLRMAEAARGERSRRSPILVRPRLDGRFDIVDGNATYGAARQAEWPDLPVRLGE